MTTLSLLADGFADLVLGSGCVGCARPGRPLCAPCWTALPGAATVHGDPLPSAGTAPVFALRDYDGVLRALVLAHKERGVLALTRPLGRLLARAAGSALADLGAADAEAPVLLVPAPSRPAAVRQRGHDPTLAMTRVAARRLGPGVRVARLLRVRPGAGLRDQAGLGTAARAQNLAGTLTVPADVLRRTALRCPRAHVVVCDDVVTTGATLREAERALAAVGLPVLAAATLAATRRKVAVANLG